MSTAPPTVRMQMLFWLPDGSVVEYRPTENTEVFESVEFLDSKTAVVPPQWRAREVTVRGVYPTTHSPGWLTDDQRRIKELEAELAWLQTSMSPVTASREAAE